MRRRQSEAELRAKERREREDQAPRLRDEVEFLQTLKLELHERLGSGEVVATTRYVRHVVVQHAPALFEIPCSESNCENGGHDVTHLIMRALRARQTHFTGEDVCRGTRGGERCERQLCFEAHATYRDDPQG